MIATKSAKSPLESDCMQTPLHSETNWISINIFGKRRTATHAFWVFTEVSREGSDRCLVDEAQFLSKKQVQQLSNIVDDFGIPVLAYGLRTDFRGEPFEGIQMLAV